MEKKYLKILVTGSISFDEIMDFPYEFVDYFHPEKLHQINVSFVVDNLEKQIGGTATNIAHNLRLVTEKDINILAAVGKDGNDILNFFKKRKISTDGIIKDTKKYTSTGKVITDIKDNQIWGFYYGASETAKKIKLKKYAKKDSLLIISANYSEAFLNFQKDAIEQKVDYLYDPGMALTWISDKDLKTGVENCKFLVGNDYEIAMITKRIKKSVNELIPLRPKKSGASLGTGGLAVITTLGEKGVIYQSKKENYRVAGYKVKKVVDPTGAGDAWRGGFVAGLVEGKKIKESLKLGNALASFAVEVYGTTNHHPSKKEIEKRANDLEVQSL